MGAVGNPNHNIPLTINHTTDLVSNALYSGDTYLTSTSQVPTISPFTYTISANSLLSFGIPYAESDAYGLKVYIVGWAINSGGNGLDDAENDPDYRDPNSSSSESEDVELPPDNPLWGYLERIIGALEGTGANSESTVDDQHCANTTVGDWSNGNISIPFDPMRSGWTIPPTSRSEVTNDGYVLVQASVQPTSSVGTVAFYYGNFWKISGLPSGNRFGIHYNVTINGCDYTADQEAWIGLT
jgi:hypothetical protein